METTHYFDAAPAVPQSPESRVLLPDASTVFDAKTENQQRVLETLQAGVECILTSDGYQNYLRTMAKFHQYSWSNSLLIWAQNPEATQVAGYRRWQELGRQVRKGEQSIKIFVPHKRKVHDEEADEDRVVVKGFGIGSVFDLSQTDGEPLPEKPPLLDIPDDQPMSHEVNHRLSRFGINEGYLMESKDFPGAARGFWNPAKRQICIRRSAYVDEDTGEERYLMDPLSPTKTKTLAHELGHAIANHSGADDRGDAEVVAESAAYVALNRFGIDSANYSFGYIAGWGGDMERIRRNLADVQRVANVLIAAIDGNKPLDGDVDSV